jgi:hypothetical protein
MKDLIGNVAIPIMRNFHTGARGHYERVTLQDLLQSTSKDEPGYEKTRFSGERTGQDV